MNSRRTESRNNGRSIASARTNRVATMIWSWRHWKNTSSCFRGARHLPGMNSWRAIRRSPASLPIVSRASSWCIMPRASLRKRVRDGISKIRGRRRFWGNTELFARSAVAAWVSYTKPSSFRLAVGSRSRCCRLPRPRTRVSANGSRSRRKPRPYCITSTSYRYSASAVTRGSIIMRCSLSMDGP